MEFGGGTHRWRREAPTLTMVRLGLTVSGLILWGYGAHADVEWLRVGGIGLFVVVILLRYWPGRSTDVHDSDAGDKPD